MNEQQQDTMKEIQQAGVDQRMMTTRERAVQWDQAPEGAVRYRAYHSLLSNDTQALWEFGPEGSASLRASAPAPVFVHLPVGEGFVAERPKRVAFSAGNRPGDWTHTNMGAHTPDDPAPKVTPSDVERAIVGETYTVLPNGRTTVCQLTLDNGFTVEGLSACVSLENFNAEIGIRLARERAVTEVWQLLGFRLADRIKGR